MELLRRSKAAKRLVIRPMTLRQWAIDGKISFAWVGRERRVSSVDVESMKRGSDPTVPAHAGRFCMCVTTFAGRLYGIRSAQNRKRLLVESGQCGNEGRAA